MSYVSLAEFKTYIRNEIPVADDPDLQQTLDAADQLINKMCGRVFTVAGVASPRTYAPTPASRDVLRIHDATTISSVVENGATLTVASQYQAEPVNTTQWSGEVWPYEQIRRQGMTAWYGYRGTGTVVVTGTWGWAATPAAVKMAAKILAKDIISYRDLKFGLVGITEYGGVKARQASLVGELLDSYKRPEMRATSHSDLIRSGWGDASLMPASWDGLADSIGRIN